MSRPVAFEITPGGPVAGRTAVPGDKSIAHRWLLFAATAEGTSPLEDLPLSLDVRSTALAMAALSPKARPALELWASNDGATVEGGGSTWNEGPAEGSMSRIEVEGEGRSALVAPAATLDCGNSGTSMRLLAGLLAAAPFPTVLTGDESLSARPMERVAAPLRAMGALVSTTDGHAPVTIEGGRLSGIEHATSPPSAQVKTAVLLAGLAADGATTVLETVPTRDHTERLLVALGAPVTVQEGRVAVTAFQHGPVDGRVPGDPSSAAFLLAAAAVTGGPITIEEVGCNPTRLAFVDVARRMGADIRVEIETEVMGEPVGTIALDGASRLVGTRIEADEVPLVIDEIPVLAALAAHARGETRIEGAAELRTKESDRLAGTASGLRGLGAHAGEEGDDLVIAGGGLGGGRADALGDHRLAMAFTVAALAGDGPSVISGAEAAAVSFPTFPAVLARLGAGIGER